MYRIKKIIKSLITRKFKYSFDNIRSNNNLYFLNDQRFLNVYKQAKFLLNFKPDIPLRVHQAIWCANYSISVEGDIVELGTGKGFLFYNILSHQGENLKNKKIYLCDTFLPYKTNMKTGSQLPENGISDIYAGSLADVKSFFSIWHNVNFVQGLLPASLELNKINLKKISFLHVDLNYFKAEIDCLELLWDKISIGGIILLDDFGNPGRELQLKNHLDFFSSKGQFILSTASGQGIIIKR
jgi:O-methyltransferase